MSERMSLMPLHMYILHYVKMLCVMCTDGVTCLRANASCECNYVLSTSKHFFRMQLLRTLTVILHILHILHIPHPTSHPRVYRNVHHIAYYCIREHYIPFLLYSWDRHHTNLFVFIVIYYLFEDVIFKCDGISKSRHRSIGRSVGR